MNSKDYLINEIANKISKRLFNQLYALTNKYPTKEDIHKLTADMLLKHKGIGKVGINEFYTVVLNKKSPFNLTPNRRFIDETKMYSAIEAAIIRWNLDGTKTAGELTREIMVIIKQKENGGIK
jgi:hypothetical protein